MSSNEATVQVDRIALIARALRSLDTAGFMQLAVPRSARRKPRSAALRAA